MSQSTAESSNLKMTMPLISGNFMLPDEQVYMSLHSSGLVENLRDFEINMLAKLTTAQYLEAKNPDSVLIESSLQDSLMILVKGDIKINAMVAHEPVCLQLRAPGDLARVVSFVGGSDMKIYASIKVRKDSVVLLLQRSKLETLLTSYPTIVYCVMRNLVRCVHGIARRRNVENEEMKNYIYHIRGRY